MYERSAIVLERYYNNLLKLEQKPNLKSNYKSFKEIVEEIQKYQSILDEEDVVISEFDKIANEIRKIQQEQKKIYKLNIRLEEERNQLFESLDENPTLLEKKLQKVQDNIVKNNERLEELQTQFIEFLATFNEKQQERNRCSRERRTEEKKYLKLIDDSNKNLELIEIENLKKLKSFLTSEKNEEENEITEIMINNGKDEKLPFNNEVIEKAVTARNQIAKKETECYLIAYDKMRKLLAEVSNDEIKIEKYKKALRDISIKLSFLKAEKNYIVSFLDNERMTAINGEKVHKQLMDDACQKFDLDIEQFNNLYELILREIAGKSTKKAYKELYDKEYLKNIEEKERKFEKEINNIKIKAGTIINSNYWRIEEIKNIYEVFLNEVSEKFEKDLSEYKLETIEDIEENEESINDILGYNDIYVDEENDDLEQDEEFDYDEEQEEWLSGNEFSEEDDDDYDEDDNYYDEDDDNIDEEDEDYYDEDDDDIDEDDEDYYDEDDDIDEKDDDIEYIEFEDEEETDEYDDYDEEADLTNILKKEILKNAEEDDSVKVKKQKKSYDNSKKKNSKGLLNKIFKDKKK